MGQEDREEDRSGDHTPVRNKEKPSAHPRISVMIFSGTESPTRKYRPQKYISEFEFFQAEPGSPPTVPIFREEGNHDIRIDASQFRKVADNPWMGFGANNYAKGSDGKGPENRRVTFALLMPQSIFK